MQGCSCRLSGPSSPSTLSKSEEVGRLKADRVVRSARYVLWLIAWFSWVGWANGLGYLVEPTADGNGILVVSGTIGPGDAVEFRGALQRVRQDALGYKRVALSSIGGLIGEAFKIAAILEAERVITFVRAGDRCASACASILFLAGTYRYVEDGGKLGFHTCTSKTDLRQSAYCNDLIAMYAESRGVSRKAFRALLDTPLREPKWMGAQEAVLWGLTKLQPATDFEPTRRAVSQPRQETWFAVMFSPAPDGTCLVKIVPASQKDSYEAVSDFHRSLGPFPTLDEARVGALQRAWRYDIQGNYWVTGRGC